MLTIKNLTIKDSKNHVFINNFNYSLGNNDKIGIIGEEGNGKSTFLKAIYHPSWMDSYMVMSGEIQSDIKQMGYLPQQLPQEWENFSVCEYLLKRTPEEEIPFERYNDLRNYEILCKELTIATTLLQSDQRMGTLSGGEKVKLQMMKLVVEPNELLLLDEPTNDLDIATLAWMEQFIQSSTIPIMFISHDRTLLQRAGNVFFHFEQLNKQSKCKASIYRGSYDEYMEQRAQRIGKETQIAQKEKQEYIQKKIRLNDQRNAVHDALNDTVRDPGKAALLKHKMKNIKSQEKRFEEEGYAKVDSVEEAIDLYFEEVKTHANKIILELMHDRVQVEERILLHDVNLVVKGKDKILFIGNNGCGKSMLMKKIYQQLFHREDITLGYMPQNYQDHMDMDSTPVQYLMEEGDREDITRCRELLGRMKFTSQEMLHQIQELSEGQKAKLYMLRFIKMGCDVLLLDEPTRNLSPLSSPIIIQMLQAYQGCIIAVSHDRSFISQMHATVFEIKQQTLQEVEPSKIF